MAGMIRIPQCYHTLSLINTHLLLTNATIKYKLTSGRVPTDRKFQHVYVMLQSNSTHVINIVLVNKQPSFRLVYFLSADSFSSPLLVVLEYSQDKNHSGLRQFLIKIQVPSPKPILANRQELAVLPSTALPCPISQDLM